MKKLFCLLITMLCLATTCFAKTVVATGYGDNQNAAIKDALRHAIETSKIAVASATVVKNYKTTKDIVVTKSNAFVTDYRIIEATDTKVKLQAEISDELDTQLMSDLVKKGIIETVMNQPIVSVAISDPDIKATVVAKLVETGFIIGDNGDIVIRSININKTNNGDVGKFLGGMRTNTQSASSSVVVAVKYKTYVTNIAGHGSGVGISYNAAYSSAARKAGESIASQIEKYLFELGSGSLLLN